MLNKPENKELEEMILLDMGVVNPSLLQKIIKAWNKVHGKETELRKRNIVQRNRICFGVNERLKKNQAFIPY